MPSESAPSGQRSRTRRTPRAPRRRPTGRNGRHRRRARRSPRRGRPSSRRDSQAPRFAASMAPGPPPVATRRLPGEQRARAGRPAVRRLVPLGGVPAHHADQAACRAQSASASSIAWSCSAAARCRSGSSRAAATRRRPARPARRRTTPSRTARRRCRAWPVPVERHVGHGGEHDAAAGADGVLVTGRERAPEEQGTGHPQPASSSLRADRSTDRSCQPVSDLAPADSLRSSSSVDSTSTTRPGSSSPAQPNEGGDEETDKKKEGEGGKERGESQWPVRGAMARAIRLGCRVRRSSASAAASPAGRR